MKKWIPLLLLLALCLVFTSCTTPTQSSDSTSGNADNNPSDNQPDDQPDDKPDDQPDDQPQLDQSAVEKDPAGAIGDAVSNATQGWAADDAGLSDIIRDTLAGGSVSAHLSGATVLAMLGLSDVDAIDAVWYTKDLKENAFEFITTANGVETPVRVWLNQDALAFTGALQEGDTADSVYKLNFSDLGDTEWVMSMLTLLSEYSSDVPVDEYAMMTQLYQTITELGFDEMDLTWLTESVADITPTVKVEGKNIVIVYNLSQDDVATLLKNAISGLELTDEQAAYICTMMEIPEMSAEELIEMLNAQIDELIASANESTTQNCNLKIAINAYTTKLETVDLVLEATDKVNDETSKIEMHCTFADGGFQMNVKLDSDGEVTEIDLSYGRTAKDDTVTYALTVKVTDAGETNEIGLIYTYDCESGEFTVTADVKNAAQNISVGVGGNIVKTADTASITINKLLTQDVTINFVCSVTFTKGVEVPAMPEESTDLKSLTPEQIEAILENLGFVKTVEIWETYEWTDEANETTVTLDFCGTEVWVTFTKSEEVQMIECIGFTVQDGMLVFDESGAYLLAGTMFENPVTIEINEDHLIIDGKIFAVLNMETDEML